MGRWWDSQSGRWGGRGGGGGDGTPSPPGGMRTSCVGGEPSRDGPCAREPRGRAAPPPRPPRSAACLGVGDELFDAGAVLSGGRDGQEFLPGADRLGRILFRIVEHLAAAEQGGRGRRGDRQRPGEGLERRVGVAADRDDEAEMRQGVHVLRITLENRLIRGDRLTVASLEET